MVTSQAGGRPFSIACRAAPFTWSNSTEGGSPVVMRTHSVRRKSSQQIWADCRPRSSQPHGQTWELPRRLTHSRSHSTHEPEENTALIQHERVPRNLVSLRSTKVAKLARIVRCQFSEVVTQNIAPRVARFIKKSQELRERHERLAHQRWGTRDSVSHGQTPKGWETAVACWSSSGHTWLME